VARVHSDPTGVQLGETLTEFTEVITEGTLSPTNKSTDWNVVITERVLLEAMRTSSPPPEKIRHGLATLYNNTFPTHEEYREFTVNCLTMWGNTLDYKLFNTLYMTHQYHSRTIKRLREQAMCYERLLFFFSSSLTCNCLMPFILLILT
jgi:hypothetical protein